MKAIIIIQFIRPHGKRAEIFAQVPDELHGKAMLLAISCELIDEQHAAIYAHVKGESEEDERSEIAELGSKTNGPQQALERLINRF